MKKRLTAAILAAAMAVTSLTACGGSGTETTAAGRRQPAVRQRQRQRERRLLRRQKALPIPSGMRS